MRLKKSTGIVLFRLFCLISLVGIFVFFRSQNPDANPYSFDSDLNSSHQYSSPSSESGFQISAPKLPRNPRTSSSEQEPNIVYPSANTNEHSMASAPNIEVSSNYSPNTYSEIGYSQEESSNSNGLSKNNSLDNAIAFIGSYMAINTDNDEDEEQRKLRLKPQIQENTTAKKGFGNDRIQTEYCDCDGNGPIDCTPDPNCDEPTEVPLDGHEWFLVLASIGLGWRKLKSKFKIQPL